MKKQAGFTLIELVIVVVILGFLAVTAIPKFIDLTEQAKQANIEGMAGGFATGVSLARAQWESEGRTNNGTNNTTIYDGVNLVLTTETTDIRPGYITGLTDGAGLGTDFDAANCKEIWDNIFQQPPTLATFNVANATTNYIVAETGDLEESHCIFYLRATLDKDTNGNFEDPGVANVGNNFTYYPASSRVEINIAVTN
ncbi:MAG: type II secretion system protein [Alteromonadaceae bacterium]|jgi:MSHA pilin protein MshB